MGKDALVCILADRPYGSTKTFIARDLAHAVSTVGGCGQSWYLVQFEAHGSIREAQAALEQNADVRRWIQTENPAWRDKLGDMLRTATWPNSQDVNLNSLTDYSAQSSSGDNLISSMVPVGPPLSKR